MPRNASAAGAGGVSPTREARGSGLAGVGEVGGGQAEGEAAAAHERAVVLLLEGNLSCNFFCGSFDYEVRIVDGCLSSWRATSLVSFVCSLVPLMLAAAQRAYTGSSQSLDDDSVWRSGTTGL
jgi:hypothetical protein